MNVGKGKCFYKFCPKFCNNPSSRTEGFLIDRWKVLFSIKIFGTVYIILCFVVQVQDLGIQSKVHTSLISNDQKCILNFFSYLLPKLSVEPPKIAEFFTVEIDLNLSKNHFGLKIWTGKTNQRLIAMNTLDPWCVLKMSYIKVTLSTHSFEGYVKAPLLTRSV